MNMFYSFKFFLKASSHPFFTQKKLAISSSQFCFNCGRGMDRMFFHFLSSGTPLKRYLYQIHQAFQKVPSSQLSNGISNVEFVIYYKQTVHSKNVLLDVGEGERWGETLVTWRFGEGYRAYIWVGCFSFSLIRFLGIDLF